MLVIILSFCSCEHLTHHSQQYKAGGFLLEVLKRPRHNDSRLTLSVHTLIKGNPLCPGTAWLRQTSSQRSVPQTCLWPFLTPGSDVFRKVHLDNEFPGCTVEACAYHAGGVPDELLAEEPFPSPTQTLRAPSSSWNVNSEFSCVCYGCAGPRRTHNVVTT